MLRLKARKPAMREIADAPILKAGFFVDVKIGEVDLTSLRYHIAVPEPMATTTTFQKIIHSIEDASEIRACDGDGSRLG